MIDYPGIFWPAKVELSFEIRCPWYLFKGPTPCETVPLSSASQATSGLNIFQVGVELTSEVWRKASGWAMG